MVGKIQTQPRGLLSYLGIKSGGRNPENLADQVVGVVRLDPFYRARNLFHQNVATAGLSAVNDVSTLTVPQGQAWLVYSVTAHMRCTTIGDQVLLSIRTQLPPPTSGGAAGAIRIVSMNTIQTAVAATAALPVSAFLPEPLLLHPGDLIEALIEDISLAAGTRTVNVGATFSLLEV